MNRRTIPLLTLATFGALSIGACAFAAPVQDASGAALTIYNENFAVVRDTIPLDLIAGINHVSFTGITAQVEPDSVILRDPAGKRSLAILEQDYRGDTVSEGLLLALNEGKTIDFEVPGVNGAAPTIVVGKIIRSGYAPAEQNGGDYYPNYGYGYSGYGGSSPVDTPLIEVDGKLRFGLPGTPLFPALADDSILYPTLEWTLFTDKPGPLNAELAYITEGITWDAAYNIVAPMKGSNLDITAWVTIDNECGKEFDSARIKLMAGDVNKFQPNNYATDRVAVSGAVAFANPLTMATQQTLDEYHLYTLPNATTLRNHETKQVQFLHTTNVASKEVYNYDGAKIDPSQYNGWNYDNIRNSDAYGTESNTKVEIEREFVNSEANGLGVPLPAGRVRFYREDSDGQLEFIGENTIDHTPKDETVKVVTGNAFDVVGSRTQTNYSVDQGALLADESFSIVLDNHKTDPVTVNVVEHLYRGDNWTISAHSDPFDKIDAHTIQFTVSVPPSGSKTVTYTAHYTW